MHPAAQPVTPERLAAVKALPECVTYCEHVPAGRDLNYTASICGLPTGEIFVQLTDGQTTRIRSFVSRHKSFPVALRREHLPLVDIADAFAVARTIAKHWGRTRHPFT